MSEDTYTAPAHGWTCFHCGETFTTVGSARDHFGAQPDATPGCMLKVTFGDERGWLMELRKLEAAVERWRNDAFDETTFYREYHAKLESDIRSTAPAFKNCRSLRDMFNVFDSMEGRALAAEERAATLHRCVRLMARGLLFYAHANHLVGFDRWEAPDQPNWDCPPQEAPGLLELDSMMAENGGWAAAVLRKVFGRRMDKYGRSKTLGEKPANFCEAHSHAKPCARCESQAERQVVG